VRTFGKYYAERQDPKEKYPRVGQAVHTITVLLRCSGKINECFSLATMLAEPQQY
jgi:hypothetical protein